MGARSQTQSQTGGSLAQVSVGRGIASGIGGFLLAFVVCTVLLLIELSNTAMGFRFLEGPRGAEILLSAIASAFYSAHLGATSGTVIIGNLQTVPEVVYFAVPVGALVLVGFWSAQGGTDITNGFAQGGTTAVGYAILTVGSVFVFGSVTSGTGLELTNELVQLVGVVGIGYPLVFGGLGGAMASQLGSSAGTAPRAGGVQPNPQGAGRGQGQRQPTQQQPQGQSATQHQQGATQQQQPQGHAATQPCPSCGTVVDSQAQFCSSCGTEI